MKPYYDEAGITIYHGDCREVLPRLAAEAIVTDPPFNVGKQYGDHSDDLPQREYRELMAVVADAAPVQAWITPTNRLSLFASLLSDAYPVVVRRGAKGPKRWGWFDQFDMILVRGRPSRFVSNLWEDIRLKGEGYYFREDDFGHPGYTPYPLLARLVALLCPDDGVVVDPFVGTGTTLRAAKDLERKAVGIEIEERYCEIAAKRLAQEVLPLRGGRVRTAQPSAR